MNRRFLFKAPIFLTLSSLPAQEECPAFIRCHAEAEKQGVTETELRLLIAYIEHHTNHSRSIIGNALKTFFVRSSRPTFKYEARRLGLDLHYKDQGLDVFNKIKDFLRTETDEKKKALMLELGVGIFSKFIFV